MSLGHWQIIYGMRYLIQKCSYLTYKKPMKVEQKVTLQMYTFSLYSTLCIELSSYFLF